MTDTLRHISVGSFLALAVVASAIACVYAKHESRKLFTELQVLNAARDQMEVEWGQLRIEQGTWSTYARVEQLARTRMKMHSPSPEQTRLLRGKERAVED